MFHVEHYYFYGYCYLKSVRIDVIIEIHYSIDKKIIICSTWNIQTR